MKKIIWKILYHFLKPVKFSRENIKDILVIRLNRIGDMICTIPLLKTLRKEFPEARLTVLAEETNVEVIKNASYIDKLLIYKKGNGIYKNRVISFIKTIKDMNFDLAIGVKGGFSSNLAIAVFLSRALYRVGYVEDNYHPLELLYNLPVKKGTVIQRQTEQCLNLLTPVGIAPDRFIKDISIEISEKSKVRFSTFLNTQNLNLRAGKVVIVNISTDRPENTWPIENFAQIIKQLQGDNSTCIITSSPGDFGKAKMLSEICSDSKHKTIFFETPHIMDFASATERVDLLICHDSGAMHIGASVGTKTLVMVGRSSPAVWANYGKRHKCLMSKSPSLNIKDITVDEVFNEARRMLDLKDG